MNKKRRTDEDAFNMAEIKRLKEIERVQQTNKRQQRWRDRTNSSETKSIDFKNKCASRYMKKKAQLLLDKNSLLVEHCVDQKGKRMINTPLGLIRYSDSNSQFAIQLEGDCTVLNPGHGAYGLVVKKGFYCFKINAVSQDGKAEGDVKFRCVEHFYGNKPTQKHKSNTKTIRFSKAYNISFEKNSLNVISEINDLKQCTAPYVGMSTI
jgi:hypothetical protein